MISVCIITKNESEYLLRNLQILKKYPCEIVVVDTGSSDSSVEIAKEYADICGYFEWCDDFSKAKNYAVSLATNNIILVIDTDEMIEKLDVDYITDKLEKKPLGLGKVKCVSTYMVDEEEQEGIDYISRVFDRRYFHFEGCIHEQIVPNQDEGLYSFLAPVEINHLGYNLTGEEKHRKAERNIRLLLKEYEEHPTDAYIIYQLGKAYMYDDKDKEALSYFEKTFEMELDSSLDWVENLIVNTGNLYIKTGQKEKALSLECLQSEFQDSADFHFMMGYTFMQNAMFDRALSFFRDATKMNEGQMKGSNSYNSFYNMGVIYECLGDVANSMKCYEKCGDFRKAIEGIKRIKIEG